MLRADTSTPSLRWSSREKIKTGPDYYPSNPHTILWYVLLNNHYIPLQIVIWFKFKKSVFVAVKKMNKLEVRMFIPGLTRVYERNT